ncbi:MAG TPA: hypothetical protein VNY36_05620 [Bacteroidia bacterium]|jgi:hypothetical protein|nr:hypothetical protein [Bacteroidia bacterium]
MKRILIALFLSLCIEQNINAQFTDTSKVKIPFSVAFISLNAGACVPLGKYQTQGFAQTSYCTSIMAASTMDDSILGFAAKIGYGVNSVNENAFAQSINENNSSYSNSILSIGHYSYETGLVGIYFAGRSCRKFGFNIRLLIGYMFTQTPQVTLSTYDPNYGGSYFQGLYSSSTGGFCYNPGIGFTYLVGKHLSLFADADYMHANPQFFLQGWVQGVSGTSLGPVQNYIAGAITRPFTITTITVGIGFKLPGLHFYN